MLIAQKLLHFLKFHSLDSALFLNNLVLYLKDLKSPVLAISAFKLVALSLEENQKLSVVLE